MSKYVNRLADDQEPTAEDARFIEQHVISSTVVAFGLGVAAGLAVVSFLADSGPSRRAAVSERLGAQLLDSLSTIVPDSLMPNKS